jgi:hypothetical protein
MEGEAVGARGASWGGPTGDRVDGCEVGPRYPLFHCGSSPLGREKPPCQAGMEEAPLRSALIAFHNLQAHRGAQHELPDWAVAAHRSATALAGVLPVVLMTNSPFAADPRVAGPFHRAVRVDLLKSGWTSGLDLGGRLRALCGLKIHALLHGWERGIVGPQVLRHSAPRTRLATPRLRFYAPGP